MKKITSVLFLFYCFSVGWAQTVPPCTLEITDAETFARDWTVIDVNSDVSANTWAYNDGNAMYTQDKSNAADDWLIAPAVTLEAGKAYKVSAYVKHSSTFGSDKQKIELKIGTAPTVEGLTTRLVYDESFQSRLFVEKSGTFSPAESGVFYVGLRCYSESYNGDRYRRGSRLSGTNYRPFHRCGGEGSDVGDSFMDMAFVRPFGRCAFEPLGR